MPAGTIGVDGLEEADVRIPVTTDQPTGANPLAGMMRPGSIAKSQGLEHNANWKPPVSSSVPEA